MFLRYLIFLEIKLPHLIRFHIDLQLINNATNSIIRLLFMYIYICLTQTTSDSAVNEEVLQKKLFLFSQYGLLPNLPETSNPVQSLPAEQ